MPKASEVANELRKLADALDQEPDIELIRAEVDFPCKYIGDIDKPIFLALARILPRPLVKRKQSYDDRALEISHTTPAMRVTAEILQSKVCKLVQPERIIPAVYDCEPLLSIEEEESLA
jgi:hypothetical protein